MICKTHKTHVLYTLMQQNIKMNKLKCTIERSSKFWHMSVFTLIRSSFSKSECFVEMKPPSQTDYVGQKVIALLTVLE